MMKNTLPKVHDPVLEQLAKKYDNRSEAIVEILAEIQSERGSLTAETISNTAKLLGIPPEKAFGVASFYSMS